MIDAHILAIPPYVAGKPIAELERELGVTGAVKMASNENPLGPSPMAIKAIEADLAKANVYPESSAPELRAALAEQAGLSPDHVILGNGSDEIMEMLAHVFIRPGCEALMGEHTFSMYRICVEAYGGTAVRTPMPDYRVDLGAMARAVTDRTRIVFLANPNSPTGTIVTRRELDAFVKDLPAERLVLVLDEAYREYVRDPDCPVGVDYLGKGLPVLTLRTFSKVYGLAGLRVGYGYGDPWLVELLNRVRAPFNVNSLAQTAAVAALKDSEHLERTLKLTHEGIERLATELTALGLEVAPSEANFVAFRMEKGARQAYEALLRRGVIVRHLGSFGLDACIRVTVGTDSENTRFINGLREVMSEL